MMIELRWKASLSATCLHAVSCYAEGLPIADEELSALLKPAADDLLRELTASSLAPQTTLPLLVSLAAEYENNRELIETTVRKLYGEQALNEENVSRLASCIAGLETVLLRQRPQLTDELAVRGRPLREQWEARGPGLLGQAARLVDASDFLAPTAEVVLVTPLVGGHGQAHLQTNRVTIEAVLANPHPELPETLRLGWLLAQLSMDLPRYSDPIAGNRLALVARLATIPLILAAAETVELGALTPQGLDQALQCWHLPTKYAEQLHNWWQAYSTSETRWEVALAALEAMLEG